MLLLKIYFPLLFFSFFSIAVSGQLKMDSIYSTAYIQTIFDKASAEKDSNLLGIAAFQLHRNLKYKEQKASKRLNLIMLSMDCFAATQDSLNYYSTRMALVTYYFGVKRFEEIKRILAENLAYYHRHQNWKMKVHTLVSLARAYRGLGDSEKAKNYYNQGLALNKIAKDTLIDIIDYMAKARNFKSEAQYDSLLLMAYNGISLSKATQNSHWEALHLFYAGWGHQLKKEYDLGLSFFEKVILIKKIIPYSTLKKNSYKHLSKCYEKKGNYKKAHQYALAYAILHDSISKKTRNEALDKLTIVYETKEKQTRILALEEKNDLSEKQNAQKTILLYTLSIFLMLFFLLFWFLIRFYREKSKKDKIITTQTENINQQKIQTLENKMELAAAKAMLDGQENERTRIAIDLHDSLGGLLSTIKLKIKNQETNDNNSTQIEDLLDKATNEVRFIAKNLQPTALQQFGLIAAIKDLINDNSFPEKAPFLNFQHYNVPENIGKSIELQLYRIIQEALNNAIKHAEAREILIQINGEIDGISLLIEDNGKGFNTTQQQKGNGLQNIRKRAAYLHAEISIKSDKKGTTVFLLCPIIE